MTTLANLRAAVRLRCSLPDNDQAVTDANVDDFINQAVQRVSYAADWAWLEALDSISLSDTNNTYAFSFATVRRWVSFSNRDGHMLEERSIGDVLAMQKVLGDGTPMYVAFEGPTVYFAPGSSGTQTVDGVYIGVEAELSTDGSSPTMPSVYDEAVIWYAAHLVFVHRRMANEAASALAQHKDALADMIRNAPVRASSIGGGEAPATPGVS